jgi:hypothetical protein
VVTLDEYFTGNTDEECVAPNQVGYARPALAELYARFKAIQQKSNVQAVLMGIHGDWTESLKYRRKKSDVQGRNVGVAAGAGAPYSFLSISCLSVVAATSVLKPDATLSLLMVRLLDL